MLTLIVARAADGAIGRQGKMPWKLSRDLALFRRETLGGALIMGRLTWESLPERPLKGRFNCVVSRSPTIADSTCRDVASAIAACTAQGHHWLYGIGGQRIYEELRPFADRILVTEVPVRVPDADAWFAPIDPGDWHQSRQSSFEEEGSVCVLREFMRRQNR